MYFETAFKEKFDPPTSQPLRLHSSLQHFRGVKKQEVTWSNIFLQVAKMGFFRSARSAEELEASTRREDKWALALPVHPGN